MEIIRSHANFRIRRRNTKKGHSGWMYKTASKLSMENWGMKCGGKWWIVVKTLRRKEEGCISIWFKYDALNIMGKWWCNIHSLNITFFIRKTRICNRPKVKRKNEWGENLKDENTFPHFFLSLFWATRRSRKGEDDKAKFHGPEYTKTTLKHNKARLLYT